MTFDDYAWWVQIGLSLLFAVQLARMAGRKGRHPFGAALLVLAFANGWPLVFGAVGNAIGSAFEVNPVARAMLGRIYGYGGVMFGVAVSFVIVGCLKPVPKRLPPASGAA